MSGSELAPPRTIGVLGAGTMGAGIAQLACQAGARTLLYDPSPEALAKAMATVPDRILRESSRVPLSSGLDGPDASALLRSAADTTAFSECDLVIEAAPESLELKRTMFQELTSGIVSDDCVLATNTSSLLVTAVATVAHLPERVVGMHFFNPPARMQLLEVIPGEQTSERTVALARAAGEAMGKHVIVAVDGPGFLVNRCNRPFGLEALQLLREQIAAIEEIDRICRLGGGFRMGPFEVMDLVGVDVGLDVSKSFYEQSFGEPRWRPSPITVKAVAAGRLGRKVGRGYYTYSPGRSHREPDPQAPVAGGGDGLIVIGGDLPLARELADAAIDAGWSVLDAEEADGQVPFLILDLGLHDGGEAPLQGGPQAICCASGSLVNLDPGGSAVGFHALPPLSGSALIELTCGLDTSEAACSAAERFFTSLGKHVAWVGDAPGLVLGRILCQVVNEAAFALGEGVGSAGDIDAGMLLGLNYPHGILHWADTIGLDHVLSVLEALHGERGDERYRAAPALQKLVASGRVGRQTGEGFFAYDD